MDGDNILIRDEPRSFANAVVDVLEDGALGRRLGERGRDTAERIYSWDVIGRRMIDTYLTVAHAHFTATASAASPIGGEAHAAGG